ncbi:MAG: hypothetical protein K2X29_08660, partial [Candidatus Obscuribacterales bacterium]|nr:hypothetical protein [Candidatus Obscuribacterales bacterium]
MTDHANPYSAAAQSLGFIYQPRFALLRMLESDEKTSVLIEKSDDLEFTDPDGEKNLGSLKHKAAGGRLTDLSVDFWKSVRVWLDKYEKDNKIQSQLRFFLFTTETVAEGSLMEF